MVFVLQSFIAFLFFCESFFPTITRQGFRSSVGVFPLRIYPSGFFSFAKATVFHHHRRMVKFVINFSKTRCKLQSQIWDPGTLSIGLEDGVINFQTYCITNNRLLFFSTVMESTPRLAPIGSYDWLTFLSNLRKGEQFWICYPEKYNCDFIVCGKESWMLSFDNSRIAMSPFICMDRHFFWMESKSIKTDWIELWMHQVD
ncbi:unnamed protein product, partial [Arabidopsis lyrata]|uniref:Predicted protein n=1 Tax=Arabidopsis lyrata subsp. lyrata TaxID=81972 RepID=D7LRK5_ARALL